MPADPGGEIAKQESPPAPKSKKWTKALKIVGGGTLLTALITSGVLSLVIVILGGIAVVVLAVVAIVVLKDDGESTPIRRLLCLLGTLFGRPATRFLLERNGRPRSRLAPAITLPVSPPSIEGQGGLSEVCEKNDAA